jgi:7-cyano-7-deazaguanine synthase
MITRKGTKTSADSEIAVLVSGGLDSSILAAHLLHRGRQVHPVFVRQGLVWENHELAHLRRFLVQIDTARLMPLVTLDLPLADLYEGHWSITGTRAPRHNSPDEAVFLPGRNALLTIKAVFWCQLHAIPELAIGVLGSNPFDDATTEFFDHLETALNCGGIGRVKLVRPLAAQTKQAVMQLGQDLPLEETFSCIAPVGPRHCGVCNKCAERQRAFAKAGRRDPTTYAARLPATHEGSRGRQPTT